MEKLMIRGDRLLLAAQFVRYVRALDIYLRQLEESVPEDQNSGGFSQRKVLELLQQRFDVTLVREFPPRPLGNPDWDGTEWLTLMSLFEDNPSLSELDIDVGGALQASLAGTDPINTRKMMELFASGEITEAMLREPVPTTA